MDLIAILGMAVTSYLAARALARWKGLNENAFGAMGAVLGAVFVPVAIIWPPRKDHVPHPGSGGYAVATTLVWLVATLIGGFILAAMYLPR
jgi:hypothetical protein